MCTEVSISAFSNSAGMSSGPADLLFLSDLIAFFNGRLLTTTEDQNKRWVEHFQQLLNRPPPTNPPALLPSDQELDINCEPPTETEVSTCSHGKNRFEVRHKMLFANPHRPECYCLSRHVLAVPSFSMRGIISIA